jgi:protein translocase SecG subunit
VLTVLMYAAYVAFGLTALLMVFAILLQEGKGGGLSALGGTQAESAFGSSNPIRRATVILSIVFFVLAGVLTYVRSGRKVKFDDVAPAASAQATSSDASADANAETPAATEARAPSDASAAPTAAPSAAPTAGGTTPAPPIAAPAAADAPPAATGETPATDR